MDDIPNQIQSVLGIIADVNRCTKDGLDYIEIKVNSSTYPVNYHGEYHYRSGSTKQLLQGAVSGYGGRVIDLIYTKYLKAAITYEHDVRVETYPFPREGVREAIYNALGHNNYAASIPIQIRIEDDAMYISNNCILPKDWTVETLMKPHKSEPFNPSIANVFYRAGYIESWGRGIQKICEACRELGTAEPEYTVLGNDLTVKFSALESVKVSEIKISKYQADTLADTLDGNILTLLKEKPTITQNEMAVYLGISVPSIKRKMKKLLERGLIVRKGGRRYGYWETK